jgi:hypothetical protein
MSLKIDITVDAFFIRKILRARIVYCSLEVSECETISFDSVKFR